MGSKTALVVKKKNRTTREQFRGILRVIWHSDTGLSLEGLYVWTKSEQLNTILMQALSNK